MYTFVARYGQRHTEFLIGQNMSRFDFINALKFTLNLPDGTIIGFRDDNGKN